MSHAIDKASTTKHTTIFPQKSNPLLDRKTAKTAYYIITTGIFITIGLTILNSSLSFIIVASKFSILKTLSKSQIALKIFLSTYHIPFIILGTFLFIKSHIKNQKKNIQKELVEKRNRNRGIGRRNTRK